LGKAIKNSSRHHLLGRGRKLSSIFSPREEESEHRTHRRKKHPLWDVGKKTLLQYHLRKGDGGEGGSPREEYPEKRRVSPKKALPEEKRSGGHILIGKLDRGEEKFLDSY